jgi:type IV secretion system protein VirB10
MSTSSRDEASDGGVEQTASAEVPRAESLPDPSQERPASTAGVAGERGIPSVNRVRSLQSRVSSALAIGLMAMIGAGFLAWYYSHALGRGERVQATAERSTRERAQVDMVVPPLGPIHPPRVIPQETPPNDESASWLDKTLGDPPPLPASGRGGGTYGSQRDMDDAFVGTNAGTAPEVPVDRRLTGAVFIGISQATHASEASNLLMSRTDRAADRSLAAAAGASPLESALTPSVLPASEARVLPSRHLLLPKGTSVDCTLETAIDTSLESIATCVTATDTFSADGSVVLIERGSMLFGETRGEVGRGKARVFVLWTEARTPNGVIVPLESPGTDPLGRSGLPGHVNRHFAERFGAAILMSVIDGAVQAAAQSQQGDGAVVVQPSTSSGVLTEVLRETIGIPHTVLVPQGDRIQIMAARDVDFRRIYELRLTQ